MKRFMPMVEEDRSGVGARRDADMAPFVDLPGSGGHGEPRLHQILDLDARLAALGEPTTAPNGDRP